MEIEVKPFNPKASILRIREGIRQGVLLVALGVLIGAGFNGVRPSGLPWVGAWSPSLITSQYLQGLREITVEEAWSLHKTGQALFLDARDPMTFHEGHLPGALNIPPEEAATYAEEVQALAEAGMQVIAYCDGVDCPLSPELAHVLQWHGVPSVRVLVNGWSRWREAGFPVDRREE